MLLSRPRRPIYLKWVWTAAGTRLCPRPSCCPWSPSDLAASSLATHQQPVQPLFMRLGARPSYRLQEQVSSAAKSGLVLLSVLVANFSEQVQSILQLVLKRGSNVLFQHAACSAAWSYHKARAILHHRVVGRKQEGVASRGWLLKGFEGALDHILPALLIGAAGDLLNALTCTGNQWEAVKL